MLFECNCVVANGFGMVKKDNMSDEKCFCASVWKNKLFLTNN